MICTALAVSVSASTAEFDLKSALNSADAGATVTLTADATLTEAYSITKSVTIDLNGYTLTSTADTAFNVNQDVEVKIVGQGNIELSGMLFKSTATDKKPRVTVEGTYAPIKINHTGEDSNNLIYAVHGEYSFINTDITAVCTNASGSDAIFKSSGSSSTATYNFVASEVKVTGAARYENCVIWIAGNSRLNVTASSIATDGGAVLIGNSAVTDNVVVIKDSYVCASSDTYQVGAIGMYSNPLGTILLENSVIESSYRVFCLSCESQSPTAEEDENGIISITSGGKVLCYDTTLLQNCKMTGSISRAIPTFLYGSSKIIYAKPLSTAVDLVNFDTASTGYTSSNKYVNIYMAEGTRVEKEWITTKTAKGIKFPDGSSPATSTTYKFIYDPVTDPEAPWVVAKLDSSNAFADANQHWFANGNGIDVGSIEYAADNQVGGTSPADKDLFPLSKVRWNKTGIYSIVEDRGNKMFRYQSTVKEAFAPSLTFGSRTPVSTADYASGVMVFEFDVATDSQTGYPGGTFKLDARTSSDYNNTGSGAVGISGISLAGNGTLTFKNGSDVTLATAKLSTVSWNRISMVVDGSTREVDCFVNGKYVATLDSLHSEGAYIWGIRFDTSRNIDAGRSLLIDNTLMSFYSSPKTKTVEAENVNLTSAEYLYGAPVNKTPTRKIITVGDMAYTDIDSAITAAAAIGTMPQLNESLANVKVSVSGRVSANGNTLTFAADSLPYTRVDGTDGNPLYYNFDKNPDAELTFHWKVGDILTGEYSEQTTTVRVGTIPAYPYNADKTVFSATEKKIYKQVGWSGADCENPLSGEFAEQILNGETAGHVYMTPTVEAFDIAQVVVDSDGALIAATEKTDVIQGSPFYKLGDGQTYVLYKDCVMSTAVGSTGKTFKDGTFSMDLNGHTLTVVDYGITFSLTTNCTFNVYSSAPGGAITKSCAADGNNVRGNALFHMAPITDSNAKIEANVNGSVHNSVLNVGKIDGICNNGSNLTLSGDCVIEPRTGDKSCAVNIDGATLVRIGHAYASLIYPRYYSGTVTVKNATLINTQKDYILSVPASYVSTTGVEYSATATLDGCTVIQTSEDMGVIGATTSFDSITVKNTVVSGALYANNADVDASKIKIGEKVAVSCAPVNVDESVWAKYNLAFTSDELTSIFGGNGYYKTVKLSASNGTLSKKDLYIVVKGSDNSAIPSGAVIRELEPLEYMTVLGSECVSVSWKGLGGETLKTEKYIKGGNVFDAGVSVADSSAGFTALKKVFKSWGTLPVNIQQNLEINPEYEMKDTVSGMKYNLSLYSDFNVNLYIPAEYKNLVKVYSDSAKTDELSLSDIVINDVSYVRAFISQLCNNASDTVSFYVTVSENVGGEVYTASRTVTASAAGYAKKIIESKDGSFTSADKVLVYYMLDYSNEASKYFDGEADAAISALLEKYRHVGTMFVPTAAYAPIDEGLTEVFDTVAIQTASSPSFIFRLVEGFRGNVTVSYSGGQNVREFSNFATNPTTADNKTLYIGGMKVYNFGTVLNITASGEVNGSPVSVAGRFNLDSYVKYADDNALDHLALVTALRYYSEVAALYKGEALADNITDYGELIITAPEVIYTNYSGKPLDIVFTNPEQKADITYTISDSRVKIENGCISASGDFPKETVVTVFAETGKHIEEFSLTVTTFSPNRIEPAAKRYEAEGGILSTAKQNGTVFVGDSYFTVGYWKDFYTDFADEDAYLLGVAGSNIDEWLVCSERLLYPLNPSEIIMHVGFNDIYNEAAYMTADQIAEKIISLLDTYHEKFPDAKVYFCSIESSKWAGNYEKSFTTAPAVNAQIEEHAKECDWLVYVNTRPIFCDDEQQIVYTDGDGNSDDNDDTGIYGQGSHPSVLAYDDYKALIDAARGKQTEE